MKIASDALFQINVLSRNMKTYVDRPLDAKRWQEKIKLMSAWNSDVKELSAASIPRGLSRLFKK